MAQHHTPVIHIHEHAPAPDGLLALEPRHKHAFTRVPIERVRPRLREMFNQGYSWAEVADMIDHPEVNETWCSRAGRWDGKDSEFLCSIDMVAAVERTPIPTPTDKVGMFPILRARIREHRNCEGIDTDLFYPGRGEQLSDEVLNACMTCPVKRDCIELSFCDTSTMVEGFFGAVSARQRRRLRHVYDQLGRDAFWQWYDQHEGSDEYRAWIRGRHHIAMSDYPR